MTAPRALVVGGAGFIGRHLVARLLANGSPVHVLLRPGSDAGPLDDLDGPLVLHRVREGDRAGLDAAVAAARPQQVFHLAMVDRRMPEADLADVRGALDTDLDLLIQLLAALAAADAPPEVVVRAGSLAEYGPVEAPYRETVRERPLNAYALATLTGTHLCAMLQGRLPFALVTARLALVYGPGQSTRFLVPSLLQACRTGTAFKIRRPGDLRDLMHIDDAVDGLLALAACPVASVVNLCTGEGQRIAEVAARLISLTGADPSLLSFGPEDAPGGTPLLIGSPDLAAERLGWRAQVPFEEGLAQTVAAELGRLPEGQAAC